MGEEKAGPSDGHRKEKPQPVKALQHVAKTPQPALYLGFGQLGNDEIRNDGDERCREQQNGQGHALYHAIGGQRRLSPAAKKAKPPRDKQVLGGTECRPCVAAEGKRHRNTQKRRQHRGAAAALPAREGGKQQKQQRQEGKDLRGEHTESKGAAGVLQAVAAQPQQRQNGAADADELLRKLNEGHFDRLVHGNEVAAHGTGRSNKGQGECQHPQGEDNAVIPNPGGRRRRQIIEQQ